MKLSGNFGGFFIMQIPGEAIQACRGWKHVGWLIGLGFFAGKFFFFFLLAGIFSDWIAVAILNFQFDSVFGRRFQRVIDDRAIRRISSERKTVRNWKRTTEEADCCSGSVEMRVLRLNCIGDFAERSDVVENPE